MFVFMILVMFGHPYSIYLETKKRRPDLAAYDGVRELMTIFALAIGFIVSAMLWSYIEYYSIAVGVASGIAMAFISRLITTPLYPGTQPNKDRVRSLLENLKLDEQIADKAHLRLIDITEDEAPALAKELEGILDGLKQLKASAQEEVTDLFTLELTQ